MIGDVESTKNQHRIEILKYKGIPHEVKIDRLAIKLIAKAQLVIHQSYCTYLSYSVNESRNFVVGGVRLAARVHVVEAAYRLIFISACCGGLEDPSSDPESRPYPDLDLKLFGKLWEQIKFLD
jgi:hypothetical protein